MAFAILGSNTLFQISLSLKPNWQQQNDAYSILYFLMSFNLHTVSISDERERGVGREWERERERENRQTDDARGTHQMADHD